VIFKSSAHYYGAEQDDPAFFTESMRRPHPPKTRLERDICEAEIAVREFADKHPDTSVTVLRFTNSLGGAIRTSHTRLLALPVIFSILGFDPRYQFIHEDDIAGCLEHAVRHDVDGIYNCAGDGVLALSEVASLLGKSLAPVLTPWGTSLSAGVLRRAGVPVVPEMINQLKFGRGLDNRRFKATGYRYRYTTRETVLKQREHQRLDPLLRGAGESYRYEEDVEEVLRWSPSVRSGGGRPSPQQLAEVQKVIAALQEDDETLHNVAPRDRRPLASLDDLTARDIIALLPSLEPGDLAALREHEEAHAGRTTVLRAIDGLLDTERTRV
jgi:UDP-glucose 4-epimerase